MLAPKLKHKNIVPGGGAYPLPSERGWTRDDFGHAVSQSLRIIRGSDREPDRGYLPQLIQHHRDVHLALHFIEPRENLYNKNNNKSISKLYNEVTMDKKIKQCKTFIHNVVQPGLWIRSHFLRIRFRIQQFLLMRIRNKRLF